MKYVFNNFYFISGSILFLLFYLAKRYGKRSVFFLGGILSFATFVVYYKIIYPPSYDFFNLMNGIPYIIVWLFGFISVNGNKYSPIEKDTDLIFISFLFLSLLRYVEIKNKLVFFLIFFSGFVVAFFSGLLMGKVREEKNVSTKTAFFYIFAGVIISWIFLLIIKDFSLLNMEIYIETTLTWSLIVFLSLILLIV